ncbi:MAG: Ig-like domain-containing protein, partial [Luteolibacter sp.]|nr:Ig-like domain-containing protein [Luteolibacter sp.]
MKSHTTRLIRGIMLGLGLAAHLSHADPLPPVRIMPLGDSITQGCCSDLSTEGGYRNFLHEELTLAGYSVDFVGTQTDTSNPTLPDTDHQGVPAAKLDDLRAMAPTWLKMTEDPDVILLHAGTNDFGAGATPAEAVVRMRALIRDLSVLRPHAKILVSSPTLRTDFPSVENNVAAFALLLPDLVTEEHALGRQVYYVDLHSALLPEDLNDGLHPKASGFEKMAGVWMSAISAVISPSGTADLPAIARVEARDSLTTLKVRFSKPLEDAAANAANFTLSGGVTVSAATLDSESKRIITLTTGAQTPGTAYTLTVNGVRDRSAVPLEILAGSTSAFTSLSLVDGSFESDGSSWTSSGSSSVENTMVYPAYATHGQKIMVFNEGLQTPNGVISQTIPTVPGQIYRLRFDMGAQGNLAATLKLKISIAGTSPRLIHTEILPGVSSGTTRWVGRSFDFEADNTSTSLTFEDVSSEAESANTDLLLDDVRIGVAAIDEGGAPSILNNGGFEIGELILPEQTSSVLDGWNENGSVFGYLSVPPSFPASEGGRLAVFNGGSDFFGGSISQTFDTVPGQTYLLTFDIGISGTSGKQQSMQVSQGVPPLRSWQETVTASGAAALWAAKGYTFIADSTQTTLTFGDVSQSPAGNGADLLLDNVRVAVGVARTLTVNSSMLNLDPLTGVNVTASPADANGDGNGLTGFTRSYSDGSVITLTAPLSASGNGFVKWQKNGVDVTTSESTSFVIDASDTWTAVYAANTLPVSVADSYVAEIDLPLVIAAGEGVLVNDTDADVDPLSAGLVDSPAHGGVTLNPDGSFTYTPDSGYLGTDSFTYRANDGLADSLSAATVSLNVIPKIGGLLGNGSFELGSPATGGPLAGWTANSLLGSTPFGYTLNSFPFGTYQPSDGTRFAVFNGGSDNFDGAISQSFATTPGQTYVLAFDLGITGTLGRQQKMVTSVVSGVSQWSWPEEITSPGPASTLWNAKAFAFVANDTTTTVTFSDASGDLSPSISSAADMLLDHVRVSPAQIRTLTVNSESAAGASITVSPLDANDDGDGITSFIRSYSDGALVTLTAPATAGGNDFQKWRKNGVDLTTDLAATFTVLGDLTLTAVYGGNSAPVAVGDSYVTEAGGSLVVDSVLGVLANDTDTDSNPLTAVLVTPPANGSVSLAEDGSFTYTPAPGYDGPDSFTYLANDGLVNSNNIAAVALTVSPRSGGLLANGSFELGAPADYGNLDAWTILAGFPTSYTLHSFEFATYAPSEGSRFVVFNGAGDLFTGSISQSFTTVVGQSYTVSLDLGVTGTFGQQQGIDVSVASGTSNWSWQETVTSTGPESTLWVPKTFEFVANSTTTTLTLSDNSETLSATGTDLLLDHVRVAITPGSNLVPVANGQSVSTDEDIALPITLTGSDGDADPLTFAISDLPTHGSVTLVGTVATYTPNANYNGSDSFTFVVNDGMVNSVETTISITVTPVNDAPLASADTQGTAEDTVLNFAAADLSTNDSPGPADESSQTLTVTTVSAASAQGGTVSLIEGQISYTPPTNFNGSDSFTYTIADDGSPVESATGIVNVTVAPVNDAPIANADTQRTAEDVALSFAAADLSTNDSPGPVDESSQTLTVSAVSAASAQGG